METMEVSMAVNKPGMEPLSVRVGLVILFVIIVGGMVGVGWYNELKFIEATGDSKYQWVKIGGVVDKNGLFKVLGE